MPWRKQLKVITFDLDETLWPVDPVLQRAELLTYQWLQRNAARITEKYSMQAVQDYRHRLFQTQAEFANRISGVRVAAIEQLAISAGYQPAIAVKIAEDAFECFIKLRQDVNLFDGVEDAIRKLAAHFTLGAITNGNADIFKTTVGEYFSFNIIAEQINASKPEPEVFDAALAQAKHHCDKIESPAQILHVGDDVEKDIAGAKAAGFSTLHIAATATASSANKKPRNSGADGVLQSVSELPDFILDS